MFSIFFIPWVLLMVIAVIALPVAMQLEKRNAPPRQETYDEEEMMAEGDEMMMAEQPAEMPADAGEFAATEALPVDDFAEFG